MAGKMEFLASARELVGLGLTLYCSKGTFDFYKEQPNIEDKIAGGEIDMVINVRDSHAAQDSITDGYKIRRKAVDFSVTLLTDIKLATLIISAMARRRVPTIKSWDQYGL